MPDYYANRELAGYEAAQEGHQAVHDSWQAQEAQRQADYQGQLEAWQASVALLEGDTPPPPEPQPPEPGPEPQPPALPLVYTSRTVSEPETILTPYGEALVVPPRVVLSAADGSLFALSEEELEAAYTPTTTEEVPQLPKGAVIA